MRNFFSGEYFDAYIELLIIRVHSRSIRHFYGLFNSAHVLWTNVVLRPISKYQGGEGQMQNKLEEWHVAWHDLRE